MWRSYSGTSSIKEGSVFEVQFEGCVAGPLQTVHDGFVMVEVVGFVFEDSHARRYE